MSLIKKGLLCPGVKGQRETALLSQELLISLLLVRLISHTGRTRKLCRHLGSLCPHLILLSPSAEQAGGVLSGQLQGMVGALKNALLAVSLQSSTDQLLSL